MDPETGIWLPVGKTSGAVPEMQVDGLVPGHDYKFRVKAVNKEGESEPLETFGTITAKDPYSKINSNNNIIISPINFLFSYCWKAWNTRTRRLVG